jgi:hypothetical protein
MILGFTGTRKGLSKAQRSALPYALCAIRADQVIHGGAMGADTEFGTWTGSVEVVIYPASAERYEYWRCVQSPWLTINPPIKPLVRNVIIANRCDHLLACPAEMVEQQRSGTWATVRYARKAGKPITLLLPDGSIQKDMRP